MSPITCHQRRTAKDLLLLFLRITARFYCASSFIQALHAMRNLNHLIGLKQAQDEKKTKFDLRFFWNLGSSRAPVRTTGRAG
jgi:hypothetical protein